MPSASEEFQDKMMKWFGSLDTEGPIRFLESHGFKLTREALWHLPTPGHTLSCYENTCILFLIYEWDFGDLIESAKWKCLCGEGDVF